MPTPLDVQELQTRIAVLEVEIRAARDRTAAATASLDAWRDQAQQLTRAQKPKHWTLFIRTGVD